MVTRAKFDAAVAERDLESGNAHRLRLQIAELVGSPYIDDMSLVAITRRFKQRAEDTVAERDRLAAQLARQQIELEAGRRIIERAHAHLTAALMPPPGETVKFIDRVNAAYLLLRGEEGTTGVEP